MDPGPTLLATSLGSQVVLSWEPPSSAKVAATIRLHCCSHWVAPGRTQVMADFGPHFQDVPRASTPRESFRSFLSTIQQPFPRTYSRGGLGGYWVPDEVCSALWGQSLHSKSSTVVIAILLSQLSWEWIPSTNIRTAIRAQLHHNQGWSWSSQIVWPRRLCHQALQHLPHKATIPRWG